MQATKESVLVVDDDDRMARMMKRMLELEGYKVTTAPDGEGALLEMEEHSPDAVLLDVMMPGEDGFTVCRRIREFSTVPIIMVTAKATDEEKVEGLDSGADDYVTKPFSAVELAARVRAALRRTGRERLEPIVRCRELAVDFARHVVTLAEDEVDLTATEYKLVGQLARNAGRVLTPDQLLEVVWGSEYIGETNLLQVNIARLRRKLGDDPKTPKFVLTRPGIGYMMPRQTPAGAD